MTLLTVTGDKNLTPSGKGCLVVELSTLFGPFLS
jgi:hypothetical protein